MSTILLGACGSAPQKTTAGGQGQTRSTIDVKAGEGDRTAVGDSEGEVRGAFSEKDQDDRRERIANRIVKERLFEDPIFERSEMRRQALDALVVLDPVEVRDGEGKLTGYLTTRFVSRTDYPEVRAEARRQLEQLGIAS